MTKSEHVWYYRRRRLEMDRGTGRAKSSSPLVFCCRIECQKYSRDRRRLDVSATSNWWITVLRAGRLRRRLGWTQLFMCLWLCVYGGFLCLSLRRLILETGRAGLLEFQRDAWPCFRQHPNNNTDTLTVQAAPSARI